MEQRHHRDEDRKRRDRRGEMGAEVDQDARPNGCARFAVAERARRDRRRQREQRHERTQSFRGRHAHASPSANGRSAATRFATDASTSTTGSWRREARGGGCPSRRRAFHAFVSAIYAYALAPASLLSHARASLLSLWWSSCGRACAAFSFARATSSTAGEPDVWRRRHRAHCRRSPPTPPRQRRPRPTHRLRRHRLRPPRRPPPPARSARRAPASA
jgi:hypothetical protein